MPFKSRTSGFAVGTPLDMLILQKKPTGLLWKVALVVLCWSTTPTCLAQSLTSKFSEGDEVQVFYRSSWRPGTVLQTDRRRARVEFEYSGRMRVEIFGKTNVRYPYEANALTPLSLWRDASDQFKVFAVVTDFDEKAETVTLFRPDEGESVTLPINQLSEADQDRIHHLIEVTPPKPPLLPELTEFSLAPRVKTSWESARVLAAIPPDPPAISVGVPMGGAGFYRIARGEKLASILPIGSSAGWMVGGTRGTGKKIASRLVWVTLADSKLRRQQPIPDGELLVAVAPGDQHVLTYGHDSESGKATLTVWEASPKTEAAKPLIRWISQEAVERARPSSWAFFISPTRVIHKWGRNSFVVWDFVARQSVYTINQEAYMTPLPAVSPGKRFLALPEDKRVRIIDLEHGRTLAALPIEGGRVSGVAFSPASDKLAIMTENQIAVWTLGSADLPQRKRGDTVLSDIPFSLAWIDERSLLVGGSIMYDLELERPVWTFSPDQGEVLSGSRNTCVAGGMYCYSVEVKGESGKPGGMVVGAVELPGPGVRDIIDSVDQEQLFLIKRGDAVSLSIDCGEHSARVRAVLEAKIAENGWVLQPGAPSVLEAKMGRGERQTVTYEISTTGQQQTVSVVPHTADLTLRRTSTMDGKSERPLWSNGTATGLSPIMFLREGESLQQVANEHQTPRVEFFETVEIPDQISDGRYRRGLGITTIDSRGLNPQPLDNLPTR